MIKSNKKKIIFITVGLLALIAIVAFTYLLLIGRPFYKIRGIEKDNIAEITLTKKPLEKYKDGVLQKDVTIYYNEKANSAEFNELNDMLSELRLGISSKNKWKADEGKDESYYYQVSVITKKNITYGFYFLENDENKIRMGNQFDGKLYRKCLLSKLDVEKYFTEDNK